jgi:DNA repair protein RAD50
LPTVGHSCSTPLTNRYKSEGNDRKIDQNEVQLDDIKREIAMANDARTTVESAIASSQDELSRAESLRTNISANVRYRDEEKEIQKVQDELDDIDIDTAARSRREFTHRYKEKLEEETDVKDKVCSGHGFMRRRLAEKISGNWRAGSSSR